MKTRFLFNVLYSLLFLTAVGCGKELTKYGPAGSGVDPSSTSVLGTDSNKVAVGSPKSQEWNAKEDVASIQGNVLLNGQPLADGIITFVPIDGRSATRSYMIRDGVYEAPQAVPGTYKVGISSPRVPPKGESLDHIPDRFRLPERTVLSTTIGPGPNKEVDFFLSDK